MPFQVIKRVGKMSVPMIGFVVSFCNLADVGLTVVMRCCGCAMRNVSNCQLPKRNLDLRDLVRKASRTISSDLHACSVAFIVREITIMLETMSLGVDNPNNLHGPKKRDVNYAVCSTNEYNLSFYHEIDPWSS